MQRFMLRLPVFRIISGSNIRFYCNNAGDTKEVPKKLRKEKSMKSFSKYVETKHKHVHHHQPRDGVTGVCEFRNENFKFLL